MPEQPALLRYISENTGSSLRITIPSKANWFVAFFHGSWLFTWIVGEIMLLGSLIKWIIDYFVLNASSNMLSTYLILITGWSIAGGPILYTWFWQFRGKEIIEVSGESILVTHKIMKFRKSKEFLAIHISDLRVAPITPDNVFGLRKTRIAWGVPPGTLAFDYGAKTVNFGSGCEEAEAKMILKEIWQTYPQYKPQ